MRLPSTVTLQTFVTNRCQVNVSLPYVGHYIVAIQIEDFPSNFSTISLSSVPVQFILYEFDSYNTVTACMPPPIITNILPWSTVNGGNINALIGVQFSGVVIARTGCDNDTNTYIASFITESPSGMQKSSFPYAWTTVPYYAMNLTWTPVIDQLGSTFTFCATVIDENGYSSQSYCINFLVGPAMTETISTTTTSVTATTTSVTTTTTTSSTSTSNISTVSFNTVPRSPQSDRFSYESFSNIELNGANVITTSFFSGSTKSLATGPVEYFGTSKPYPNLFNNGSILAPVYSKQQMRRLT
ncbi:unnamed protein product [Rotaria magnacalcarata]|uniref:Uncharacterized protein n=1 Tax=Rotaria magnacalcarata TaxID=392030 RepID=A0A816W0M6_9BILA|nr:unnamed protein product [Rotaria magnacalcarata]CAF2121937.1 unnamed protein product [Rotaria magnacalcarata]